MTLLVSVGVWRIGPGRPARLAAELGTWAEVVGAPTLQRQGSRTVAAPQRGTPVRWGDRLETGDADRAEIRFLDGTTLRLAFNTVVELPPAGRTQPADTNALQRPPEVRLRQGQVWTQVAKRTNAPSYAIRTDAATAIARGTEFGVKLQRLGGIATNSPFAFPPSPFASVLTVKEGLVDFTNAFGAVQATAMTESTARADSAPTEPRRLETLQVVQLDSGATWALVTSPLDWPEAAEKLVGGGGTLGWQLREVTGANGQTEVRISRLPTASPAARAGLRVGDVLVGVDGQAVTHARQVSGAILFRPGGAVNLRVGRKTGDATVAVPVSSVSNPLRGPVLPADTTAILTALLGEWLAAPTGTNGTTEARRLEQAAAMSRSSTVRAAAFNQLGVVLELEDTLGPAVRAYGRAVYLAPDVPLYRFNLGLALRKIGSFERALEEFQEAARLEPESVPARKRVVEVTSLLGRHEEALALTEPLLEEAPSDHSLWELQAQLLLKLRRAAEAIAPARRAAELDADCPVAHSCLAEAFQAAGKLDEALAAWSEALERAPFEPVFHLNLGVLHRERGEAAAAEQSVRQAIALQPNFALAHVNLGNLLADRRDLANAAAAFRKAMELDPVDARARWRYGDVLAKQRQFEPAERAYREALELSPNDPEALYGLGELYRLQRRPAEAERAYRGALERRPDHANAHTALGIVFYERGEVDEAERLYRRAIELDPAQSAPYHNLGNLNREARGDLEAAERWFRQALDRGPNDGESLGGMALVASDRGNWADAERLLRRAVELAPDSSALHNNLGEVLRQRGRPDDAEPFYRKALELDPDNPAPYGNLGILQAERKQFAEAEKIFRALLERSVGNARLPALVNLANVCGEQGKLEEAERLYRQALELAPDQPRVAASVGSFLADHRLKLDEALTLAMRAVRSAPDDPTLLDILGWVQAQRGELDEAERTLRRALKRVGQNAAAEDIQKHLDQVLRKKTASTNPPALNKP